ncbi:RraA family protein [Rhodobacteraceae bacterium N5(2021)]|uniref:Putative 4-hydroxy-4-methyl-2-oxoglutarate aldolase n=1 Tax=Gymnodinialimonas phycosphaerae TaxID=2841589 RepID=A0A975TV11_9RHOB|nr:RraA family protein [Gymnodinialimonas phycosphaerae]
MNAGLRLARAGTATIGEAAPEARLVDAPIRPIDSGLRVGGPARTVRCLPGDNLALHRAIAAAEAGEVLVIDYGGSIESGPFGEVMSIACQVRGIAGVIIDGAVRDSTEIVALGLPVFARGLNIRGTKKVDAVTLDAPLKIGGALVSPGDIVVADADAVIIVPAGAVEITLRAVDARIRKEAGMIERIRAGETTLHLLGLDKEITA